MIDPGEALRIVLEKTSRLAPVALARADALGGVLAETVTSDIDLPPFDKSAMDGYAVRAGDVSSPPVELAVVEELPAGAAPTRKVKPGTCAKIMTGAPVPEGADVVVMVEDTEVAAKGRVRILRAHPAKSNICLRGEDIRQSEQVLAPGTVLRPQEIGLLASVGRERVLVYRRPRVAVLATGDELVEVSDVPGPGQIRNANSWSLLGCCRTAGVQADDLGIARDREADLRERIARGLEQDVLLVSGGVSMGEWDLVPKVFDELDVTVHFSEVRQKPGKPTVFATGRGGVVFGLPGNPVSTLVTFRLYVWPCLRKMMGHPTPAPPAVTATLAHAVTVGGRRLSYLPASLHRKGDRWTAAVVETKGSADLVGFCRADALVRLKPGTYEAGTSVQVLSMMI